MNIGVVGAGGNMGMRVLRALNGKHELLPFEPYAPSLERLRAQGWTPVDAATLYARAEVVVLAVADHHIGRVAEELVPHLRPGTLVVMLDPAAPHAGVLPERADIAYFVTHPAHPSVFNDEVGEARRDYFGSGLAKQSIVSALFQGTDEDYAKGEAIAALIFAPVLRSHRVTVAQLALLEPSLTEVLAAACCVVMREGLEAVVAKGVPREAATDFLLGHINIPLAIAFEQIQWDFSAGAKRMIERGKRDIFRADWQRVFNEDYLRDAVEEIVAGDAGRAVETA
jgi:ketol-acid reductoisomerase